MRIKLFQETRLAGISDVEKTGILTRLNALKTAKQADISFDAVRGEFTKTRNQWPDGLIHQVALDAGFEVLPD